MARIPVPIGPTSDKAKSRQGGGSTLVNCYAERTEGGKSEFCIITDPGLTLFSEMASPLRGIYVLNNSFYVLSGENLYSLTSTGIQTLRGTILGSAPVIWSTNRKAPNNQVTVTSDTKNYYIENNVVFEITDPDLPAGVHSNCYLNGMTIYGINDGRMFWSDNNQTESIDALNFTEAERSADKGMRVFTNGDEVWYWGESSLEIFHDTGNSALRLEPQQNLSQGEGAGTPCKNSIAIVDSSVFWVSDAHLVVRGAPYFPQRVSNHEVERDIDVAIAAGFSNEIIGFAWSTEGHQFYHLRCPLWCHVYDTATSTWHRKENHNGASWRNAFYTLAFNKHLVGDFTSGKVYDYAFAAKDEAGDPLTTKIISSIVHDFPNGMICDALHVDVQAGVGTLAPPAHAQAPMLLLRVSRDGGMTYGTEYQQSLGAQGKWKTNVRFNRLGHARGSGMTFELRNPEPVERAFLQAYADVRSLG